jgi:hypothetical protein
MEYRQMTLQDFLKVYWELPSGPCEPILFQLGASEFDGLRQFTTQERIAICDSVERQLIEWVRTELPAEPVGSAACQALIKTEVSGEAPPYPSYGWWCYLPWRRLATHLLPKERYFAVRTNRNREKITHEEQAILRTKKVGVVGLSVGHAAAMVLAQEGLCGELRIADFDQLDLSNLNRLRTSIVNLGEAKVHIARRDLAELDPYLTVRSFETGVTDENIERFFLDGGRLDLVVEECDTLPIKLRVREMARKLRIPVVMDTNDRGLLDVERFDREPERPLMHGFMGDHTSVTAKNVPKEERLALFYGFFGGESQVSPAFRNSVKKIGRELVSYPQLASDVHLGGALVGHASRMVLLDRLQRSGRFTIDLDQLIHDHGDPLAAPPATSRTSLPSDVPGSR